MEFSPKHDYLIVLVVQRYNRTAREHMTKIIFYHDVIYQMSENGFDVVQPPAMGCLGLLEWFGIRSASEGGLRYFFIMVAFDYHVPMG